MAIKLNSQMFVFVRWNLVGAIKQLFSSVEINRQHFTSDPQDETAHLQQMFRHHQYRASSDRQAVKHADPIRSIRRWQTTLGQKRRAAIVVAASDSPVLDGAI